MQKAYDDAKPGKPADHPFMNIHMQSAVDPTVAPADKHTISIFTQYFPYTLAEGTWDERRDEIARHVIREFAKYAPNIPDAIVGMQVLAPPDIEARFGLTGGHIFHGELVPEQAFDMRPVPVELVRGADRRPVPLRLRRLAGRLRDGRAWTQRGAGNYRPVAGRPGPEGSIGQSMKVLISADMEGTCGVSSWVQVTPSENASAGEPHNQGEYDRARHRMTAEVNAAIEGALEGGADEVIVNDSHDGHAQPDRRLAASLMPVHLRQ